MAEYPSLPLFTDAFIADTIHLNAAQTGAYLMLLMCAWRTKDCSIPDDDKILARYARMTPREWKKNKDVILSFWEKKNSKFIQKRLIDERKFVNAKRDKAIQAGKASALKRKERHSTNVAPEFEHNSNSEATIPHPHPHPHPQEKDSIVISAVNLYNDFAKKNSLPVVQKLTKARKVKLNARLKDCGGLDGWKIALLKLSESDFCLGDNPKGWKADFDFLIQESSFVKLMENRYKNNPKKQKGVSNETQQDKLKRETQELLEEFRS